MNDLYLYNFDKKEKDEMVFWSGGNFPTQNSLGVSLDDIRMWFKALLLLSGKIIASSSFYYESEITREITKEFDEIFRCGDALYFIDENISNFSEHGLLKIEKSPKTLRAYNDIERVKTYGSKLDSLGVALRRSPDSISKKIQYLWAEDVYSKDDKSLGMFLHNSMRITSNREEASLQLSGIATSPPVDFVWEYIVSEANKFTVKLPKGFDAFARVRLSEIYALACADVLDLQLDLTLINRISRYDTNLFCQCMNHIGVLDALKKLNPKQLISIKQRDEFTWFREQYFKLINAVNNNEKNFRQSFEHANNIIQRSSDPLFMQENFLPGVGVRNLFKTYFKGNKKIKEYEKPVDILLSAYDAIINDIEKQNIVKWLDELANIGTTKAYPAFKQQTVFEGDNKMSTNVLVITALQEEFNAVLRHLQVSGTVDTSTKPYSFSLRTDKGFDINGVLIQSGMGEVNAGLATQAVILKYSPEIVVLTGICGGIKGASDVELGDIIVAEQHVYYEIKKIKEDNPTDWRFQVTRGGKNLLTTARHLSIADYVRNLTVQHPRGERYMSKTHFGVVFAGDSVVSDVDFLTELRTSWSRAIGIEMESYGASLAVELSNPRADFLMVKSVSDMADKAKDDSWRNYCVDIAAAYAIALIKSHDYQYKCVTSDVSVAKKEQTDVPGPVVVKLNEKYFGDWKIIATYFDIPATKQAQIERNRGLEIIAIHDWLKLQNRSSELLDALIALGLK